MTAGLGLDPLARVLAAGAVRGPLRVPAGATHLVALGDGAGADQLRHAVKVDRVASPAADAPPGTAWTRWLVWLGDARPPGPPSHLRFGRLQPGSPAGILLPCAGPEALRTVVADTDGLTVTGAADGLTVIADGLTVTGDTRGLTATADAGGLTVTAGADGLAVVADAVGARWHEEPLHTGRPVADPSWRLAGWSAAPHHRQVPVAGGGPAQTVLIVRPARTGTA